jgi:hypothetical protein
MSVSNIVDYREDAFIVTRFCYHVKLGLWDNIGDRTTCPKNALEKVGDCGIWFVKELPKKIWVMMKDPRVVTVALTALALVTTSLFFYPGLTCSLVVHVFKLIPNPCTYLWFASYIYVVGAIVSGACRAEGRFWNTKLMNEFYHIPEPVAEAKTAGETHL